MTERDSLTVEYLVYSLNKKLLQKHLLIANTSTIACTVLAINSYLAIDNSGRPACMVTGETVGNHQFDQVVSTLTTQAVVLATQSEVLATVMAKLKVIERTSETK